jgi:hypothetical protein
MDRRLCWLFLHRIDQHTVRCAAVSTDKDDKTRVLSDRSDLRHAGHTPPAFFASRLRRDVHCPAPRGCEFPRVF